MGLEATSFPSGLNTSWPLGTDSATKGDDHLRLIKSVLKNTFPGAGGAGFAKQIIATEDEINALAGLDVNILTKFATVSFPAGTTLVFYNATPPPGWSLVSMPTTYMLVCGSVTGGTTSGSDSPILNEKVPTHYHDVEGGTEFQGSHIHGMLPAGVSFLAFTGSGGISMGHDGPTGWETLSLGMDSAGNHAHVVYGATKANVNAAAWAPRYAGVILCSKD